MNEADKRKWIIEERAKQRQKQREQAYNTRYGRLPEKVELVPEKAQALLIPEVPESGSFSQKMNEADKSKRIVEERARQSQKEQITTDAKKENKTREILAEKAGMSKGQFDKSQKISWFLYFQEEI